MAWLAAALWFTVIHFRPVEYPGLLAFALVTGACLMVTGRLGMSIATHVAFNVTGLLIAWVSSLVTEPHRGLRSLASLAGSGQSPP